MTDAYVCQEFLKAALLKATEKSFNCISVDGDTSTNDCVLTIANGACSKSSSKITSDSSELADAFQYALTATCINLAKQIVKDGEGASKFITVMVEVRVCLAMAFYFRFWL